jgi:hypothetical protein
MVRAIMGFVLTVVLVLSVAGVSYAPYHTQQQPAAAQAGNAKTQITTATTHAGFAGNGTTLAYVQQHLGHALNCIEGKGGRNFNASWGNVCEGQGNGILNDLRGLSGAAAVMPLVQNADSLALSGVKSTDLATARMAARGVEALLKIVGENVK